MAHYTIASRGRTLATLSKIKTFALGINNTTSATAIETRLGKMEEIWSEFNTIEDKLMAFAVSDETIESKLDEFSDKFFETKTILLDRLRERQPKASEKPKDNQGDPTAFDRLFQQQRVFFESFNERHDKSLNQSQSESPRLPRIHIEPFTGEYTQWPTFQDLFLSTVHNNTSLSNIHKFTILTGLLKGDAAALIRHLPINDATYTEAWEKIVKRYDRKRPILQTLIETFLNQPSVVIGTAPALRKLSDTSDEVIRGIRALGGEALNRDPWLIHILLKKTDVETQEIWAKETITTDFPTFEQFLNFLNDRCEAKENCTSLHKPHRDSNIRPKIKSLYTADNSEVCPSCKKNHSLSRCFNFKKMSISRRRTVVNDYGVCYNCLREGHTTQLCKIPVSCKICDQRHHTLLHLYVPSIASSNQQPQATTSSQPAVTLEALTHNNETYNIQEPSNSTVSGNAQLPTNITSRFAILPTALVHVRDIGGKLHIARVLLDSGSQSTFISETLVQKLRLPRSFANINVTGLAESKATTTKGLVSVCLQSRHIPANSYEIKALVLSKVTSALPPVKVDAQKWNKLSDLQLADPNFHTPGNIDLLIGAEIFFKLLRPQQITINSNIIAQSTSFGWIIAGSTHRINEIDTQSYSIMITEDAINTTLQNFWKLEEVPESTTSTTSEELCENHFKETMTKNDKGRYVVRLPFKGHTPDLGNSKFVALSRLRSMERKFIKEPSLKEEYSKFMKEYLELGHMEEIKTEDVNCKDSDCYYLPHHSVIKNDSSTTKLRVVFDGSSKSSSGVSLNEKLLVGPTIQSDLVTILLQFRKNAIAFSADVEKMFRQILVHKDDQNYQRIVWRFEESHPIKHYKLNTVTYGTSCAPFLAVRCLQEIAIENKSTFPFAANKIINNFYIDDLLSGCDTIKEALSVKNDISNLLNKAGLNLRKWKSNSLEFINSIPAELTEIDLLQFNDSETVKTLGIRWQPNQDIFVYNITIAQEVKSKREFLSQISRIFDPLGWISPIIIVFKILLQRLWLQKLKWDDELPEDVRREYNTATKNLDSLNQIKIPRYLQIRTSDMKNEIHGFSDASETAYAAVIYLRSIDEEGNITTNIIASKSKVAPLKQISLPRLELCGALLLSKLLKFITSALDITSIKVFAWTDSQIVLAWLSDIPKRWKCFVGNRTAQILDVIPRDSWNHVSSKDNPADLASRGVSAQSLCQAELWWKGPTWLRKDVSNWPSSNITQHTDCEQRKPVLHAHHEIEDYDVLTGLFERVSSFQKIKRIIVIILKLNQANKRMLYIDLMKRAETICIKWAQHQSFSKEIKQLKMNNQLKNHSLVSLTPFIDGSGILRVGGRLTHMYGSFNRIHPIILPKHHILSKLLIQDIHKFYLHPGPSLLTSILRQRYWIVNARNMIRNCVNKCVKCFRYKAVVTKQLMGNLPTARITQSRPFLHTGVDYACPLYIKARSGKGRITTSKAYICLFICFSTKAVHIELASDMTSAAFIAALRRFISRRGVPVEIISDNGSNFVGADRELHELHTLHNSDLHNKLICDFLSQNEIKFTFNPSKAPNFGGLWESNIKSVKYHLKRVTGNSMMTFEEMTTLLIQIEGILNSRPLCPNNEDVTDLAVLTPGHFLIGEPLTSIPEPSLEKIPENRLSRWQNIQSRTQSFWKRWHLEYLHNLQQRYKWQTQEPNLQIGDVILIKEDNLPPTKWLLGRIIELHPGSDGLCRVVTIKTASGQLKRPISKVCKLPSDNINN